MDFIQDKNFLLRLDNERNKRIFVKITVLDNDEIVEVNEGDVIYTADGNKHYIENIGDEDLVFIAVVINE